MQLCIKNLSNPFFILYVSFSSTQISEMPSAGIAGHGREGKRDDHVRAIHTSLYEAVFVHTGYNSVIKIELMQILRTHVAK